MHPQDPVKPLLTCGDAAPEGVGKNSWHSGRQMSGL